LCTEAVHSYKHT